MFRARRARIVATLGPASRGLDKVRELAMAGADVFRVNFSHGTHADHARAIASVREAEAGVGPPLAVLPDLQGPKPRLGQFADGVGRLKAAPTLRLHLNPKADHPPPVGLPHPARF